jgi:hypothetical protein
MLAAARCLHALHLVDPTPCSPNRKHHQTQPWLCLAMTPTLPCMDPDACVACCAIASLSPSSSSMLPHLGCQTDALGPLDGQMLAAVSACPCLPSPRAAPAATSAKLPCLMHKEKDDRGYRTPASVSNRCNLKVNKAKKPLHSSIPASVQRQTRGCMGGGTSGL